ncbi:MAG: preprotein translocase subunit SecA, partial [Aridibacter sp.]
MAVNTFADKLVKKIFGTETDKYLKDSRTIVAEINDLEPEIQKLSDEQLREKTVEYKKRIQDALEGIEDKVERYKIEQETLNEIMPEAFAVVREASVRTTGMRHFDVQLVGGLILHQGKVA